MTYLMFILILIGAWALISRNNNLNNQTNPSTVYLLTIPTAGAFLAIFTDIYSWIPDFVFLTLTVCFILANKQANINQQQKECGITIKPIFSNNCNICIGCFPTYTTSFLCLDIHCYLHTDVLLLKRCKGVDLGNIWGHAQSCSCLVRYG